MHRLLTFFGLDSGETDVLRAQLETSTKQIPVLYFLLIVNCWALTSSFLDLAPLWLTITLPVLLTVFSGARFIFWLRARHRRVPDDRILKQLLGTVVIAGVLSACFVTWALALFPYGDVRAQDHVTFFIGITVVSCIFSLLHFLQAALTVTAVVIPAYVIYLLRTGDPTLHAIAINQFLVTIAMVNILIVGSRDFAQRVRSQVEATRLSEENARLANRDSLTDLPNRRQFFSTLEAMLDRPDADRRRFIVGVADLDGFKAVNDRYGHSAGDQILVEASRRLAEIDGLFVARLGGDEFGLVIDAELDDEAIIDEGRRICECLAQPYDMPGIYARIAGSIGFAAAPDAGRSAEVLYERADYALYHAKASERGRPVLFSEHHERQIRQRSIVEQCLLGADLERELELRFQPMIDISTNRPIAFEALARWTSPEIGSVPPDVFIAAAERIDLIGTMTHVLFAKALEAMRQWPDDIRLSFNLSARDIASTEMVLKIIDMLRRSGLPPSQIDLEVTETSLVADFDSARQSLQALKLMGVRIALDDFGIGYSSLSYVHRLPLDKVKVDRSFMRDLETRTESRKLLKSVIDLCRSLDIGCVAEGVETADQVAILTSLGCTTMQGYYFARPMTGTEVHAFIAATCNDRGAGLRNWG